MRGDPVGDALGIGRPIRRREREAVVRAGVDRIDLRWTNIKVNSTHIHTLISNTENEKQIDQEKICYKRNTNLNCDTIQPVSIHA